jgi:Cd2+/Zn2+-exporting ATPase
MDCAVEENEIRRALEAVPGVRALRFQLSERTLGLRAEPAALDAALTAIRKAGFNPEPLDLPAGDAGTARPGASPAAPRIPLRLVAALVLALLAEGLHLAAPDADGVALTRLLGMGLAAIAVWLAGVDTYTKGWAALRRGRLNISALMSVAVTGAFAIGEWPEAAMVMALYAVAELIEARAADRARNAIQGLLELAPSEAMVRQPDGSWRSAPSGEVAIGAVVRIRPGERVPLDGVVTAGRSAVDQSPVTGESLPVDKATGDAVFAGTINQNGELEVRVTAAAADSTLSRIIHAVEEAQATRAPTQRFVDRFSAVYTPAVFAMAVLVAALGPWVADISFGEAVYKALVLLVVACPCALVISTPVTIVSALAAAARRGILIKGGSFLESARTLRAIALDKTGTVTAGTPTLVEWQVLRGGRERDQVARLATSLAGRSDHPVSQAIARGLTAAPYPVESFEAHAGRGVEGSIGAERLVLGNHRFMEERRQCSPDLEAALAVHEAQGRTVTLLADAQGALALFAVADTIKPGSRAAVAELRELGVTAVMLSGDNTATARSVARQAGIDQVRGELLPQDKLDALRELRGRFGPTGMAGDGINDAPALAQADIGFAMGAAGTDTAMEAAAVVIMNDDLRRLPEMIRLSHRTHALLWQNIVVAVGIKAVFMVLALAGAATMWMAVFADMGATLIVVANGLRLLKPRVLSHK